MITKLPTAVAAALIQKSQDFIRWGLQQNAFPYGNCVETGGRGVKRYSYYISPIGFSTYTGIPMDVIERAVDEYHRMKREAMAKCRS